MNKEEIKSIGILTADIYLHFPMITEDEADDLDEFLEDNHIEYEGATDIFMDLEEENKQLKERIDKALERLKKIQDNAIKYGANHDASICYELIETLKGVNNE